MGGRGAAASAHAGTFGGAAFANHGGALTNHSGAFANHAAAFANHGGEHTSRQSGAMHTAKPAAGQHVAFRHSASTFRMAGTDHHHHHHHHVTDQREPIYGDDFTQNGINCTFVSNPYLNWNPCAGSTKSLKDSRAKHSS
jgi:hypothetical protein